MNYIKNSVYSYSTPGNIGVAKTLSAFNILCLDIASSDASGKRISNNSSNKKIQLRI